MDLRASLVWLVEGIIRSLTIVLFILVLLLLFRLVLRRLWMAVVVVGLISALVLTPAAVAGANWTDAAGDTVMVLLLLGLAQRVGILAMAVLGFHMDPAFPITSALGSWHGRPTMAIVAVSVLLAVDGSVVALGGRAPFGEADS